MNERRRRPKQIDNAQQRQQTYNQYDKSRLQNLNVNKSFSFQNKVARSSYQPQ